MLKTLFASACVVACCMGNEYPAKAYGSYNYGECDRICQGAKSLQRREERREQQLRLDRLERKARWSH